MSEWYKNYEKGKPFYSLSSRWTIQKHYFAGWFQIRHSSDEISDNLATLSGATFSADGHAMGSDIRPFPEENLDEVISKIKAQKAANRQKQVELAQKHLEKKVKKLSEMDSWEPELIDFKDREDYDYYDPEYGRFDHPMYIKVEMAQ